MTTTTTAPRSNDVATLRRMAKDAGIANVKVRKGKGCRTGEIHFYMAIDATREDRIAAINFLISVDAFARECEGRVDLSKWSAHFFDSVSVVDFATA